MAIFPSQLIVNSIQCLSSGTPPPPQCSREISRIAVDLLNCTSGLEAHRYGICDTHFWSAYRSRADVCPPILDIGFRQFCARPEWQRMRGCRSAKGYSDYNLSKKLLNRTGSLNLVTFVICCL